MPVKLLTGPPSSGKTSYLLNRVIKEKQEKPLAIVWVLVPDGYHALTFRRLLGEVGGAIGVTVNTFGSLYREILEQGKSVSPLAPPAVIHQLVRKAVGQVFHTGALQHYAEIRHTPGFIRALSKRIIVLKRELINPDAFEQVTQSFPPRIQEIALIFGAYQSLLQETNWTDPEGMGWNALELIQSKPEACPDWPLLILDGFDSFTATQLQIIEVLATHIPEILITLPGSSEKRSRVLQRFSTTQERLKIVPNIQIEPSQKQSHLQGALAHLEAQLGEIGSKRMSTQDQVAFIEARSPAEEAREALRWIKGLVLREDLDFRRCAVIVPDQSQYLPHLRNAGREFGLPLHFMQKEHLASSPAFLALFNLLELSTLDFPRRLLLDTLRFPYFNLGTFNFSKKDAQLLEITSRTRQILGGLDIWLDTLTALETQTPQKDYYEEGYPILHPPSGKEAIDLKGKLSTLADRISPPEDTQSLTSWVIWLEDLMDHLQFVGDGSLIRDLHAKSAIIQVLRELVLAEEVAGELLCSYSQFLEILEESAEDQTIPEPSILEKRGVMVFTTTEGRGLRHQAVAILGLSEGIFPKPQRADPFLDEEVRAALGIESAIDLDQFGLFYLACTRADKKLLLSRPYLAEDGEVWQPSHFWDAAKQLFIEEAAQVNPDQPRPIQDAASGEEALAWAMQKGKIPKQVAEHFSDRVAQLRHTRGIIQGRLSRQASGPYEGQPEGLAEEMNTLAGPGSVFSPSRLENYISCPQRFFFGNVLGFEAQSEPELGMDVAQRGSLLHRILENVYQGAEDATDLPSLLDTLDRIAPQEFAESPKIEGFRPTPLWEIEQQEMYAALTKSIKALHEESHGWTPSFFEGAFGLNGKPELVFEVQGKEIHLRGLIDRVDKNAEGELRIIDYKSGSSGLTAKDLESGKRIQLPLYALAARDALGLGEPSSGFYWAIFQAKAGNLRLEKFDGGHQAAIETALAHVGRVIIGISESDFRPSPPQGGCPSYCPATGWCWRYQPDRWTKA